MPPTLSTMRVEQATSAPFGLKVERPTIDFARTIEWKDGIVGRLTSGVGALLKRHQVKIVAGPWRRCSTARPAGSRPIPARRSIRAEHVVLATGSEPAPLPALPFGGRVISSTEALSLPTVPERLAVVGAGYIGLELGTAFAKLGAKVTVVEAEDRILPVYDAELTRPVAAPPAGAGRRGPDAARAPPACPTRATRCGSSSRAAARSIPADKILVAVGRRAA